MMSNSVVSAEVKGRQYDVEFCCFSCGEGTTV